jgi:hypothetical protein
MGQPICRLLYRHKSSARRTRYIVFSAAVLIGTTPLLTGCSDSPSTPSPPSQGVTITGQPLSQTIPIGNSATFTVTATGTAPLSYQWSEDGVPISGAISASYTTPDVALGSDGSTRIGTFQVTVSDEASSVTSKSATLTAGPRSPKAGDLRYHALVNEKRRFSSRNPLLFGCSETDTSPGIGPPRDGPAYSNPICRVVIRPGMQPVVSGMG